MLLNKTASACICRLLATTNTSCNNLSYFIRPYPTTTLDNYTQIKRCINIHMTYLLLRQQEASELNAFFLLVERQMRLEVE